MPAVRTHELEQKAARLAAGGTSDGASMVCCERPKHLSKKMMLQDRGNYHLARCNNVPLRDWECGIPLERERVARLDKARVIES